MKNVIMFLLAVFSTTVSAAGLQVIKIDESHIQIGLQEGQFGESYAINPATEVVLDATGYDLPAFPSLESSEPNAIQLIIDKEHHLRRSGNPG